MERAHSVPAGLKGASGAVVNPFYSERVPGDMLLRASRPHALPPSPTDLEGTSEGPTGTRPGKGRGGQPTGAGRGFATPPSHWKSSEPSSAAPLEGNRTEGRMPTTGEHALKSMGKVPGEVTNKSPGDLQRALEAEIVDHLRTQNAQLME